MDIKEAVAILGYQLNMKGTDVYTPINYEAIETILAELEKKEKIIDELVKTTVKLRETSNEDCFIPRTYRDIDECIRTTCEKCLKEYFKKKVEE